MTLGVVCLSWTDVDTRRRSACDLVQALCKSFEGHVIQNFSTYVQGLLEVIYCILFSTCELDIDVFEFRTHELDIDMLEFSKCELDSDLEFSTCDLTVTFLSLVHLNLTVTFWSLVHMSSTVICWTLVHIKWLAGV